MSQTMKSGEVMEDFVAHETTKEAMRQRLKQFNDIADDTIGESVYDTVQRKLAFDSNAVDILALANELNARVAELEERLDEYEPSSTYTVGALSAEDRKRFSDEVEKASMELFVNALKDSPPQVPYEIAIINNEVLFCDRFRMTKATMQQQLERLSIAADHVRIAYTDEQTGERVSLDVSAIIDDLVSRIKKAGDGLLAIKQTCTTADGWEDGETFYQDAVAVALEDATEALAACDLTKKWEG